MVDKKLKRMTEVDGLPVYNKCPHCSGSPFYAYRKTNVYRTSMGLFCESCLRVNTYVDEKPVLVGYVYEGYEEE